VRDAVKEGAWAAVEQEAPAAGHRKKAAYRVCEMAVTIEKRSYRAIVVHSDANDRRRQKKLDRGLTASLKTAEERLSKVAKTEYFCPEDAEAAAEKLRGDTSRYHHVECAVVEKVTYAWGRPPKNGERRVAKIRYVLEGRVLEREDEVERVREAAGCFVLLTDVPTEGEMAHTPEDALAAYKEQHGIERDFGFLKDPLIVNDIFLKRPDRIEVLGFILLLSLLTWNLMEHVMRGYLKRTDSTISGWDRKPTTKPTTFMMTTKFKGVLVAKIGEEWHFTAPLTKEQQQYVRASGLSEASSLRKGTAPLCPAQKSLGKRL